MKRHTYLVLIYTLALLCLLWGREGRGENLFSPPGEAHFAEHFVASGLITAGVYAFAENGLGCDKTDSFVLAAGAALMIGLIYKFSELTPGPGGSYAVRTIPRAMLENAAGVGAAGLSVLVFHW